MVGCGIAKCLGKIDSARKMATRLILKLIFLCFPSCSAAALKPFVCQEIAGAWYITADYRLECSGPKYAVLQCHSRG